MSKPEEESTTVETFEEEEEYEVENILDKRKR